jgi:quercetin dioxygenase-like cupin family protein
MATTVSKYVVLKEDEGLRLQSGPGRDLVVKVTGQDTNGAFDYFTVDVAPHGGPPLHVHHVQEEPVHVLKGRFKIRIGDSIHDLNEGGFAYLPRKCPRPS